MKLRTQFQITLALAPVAAAAGVLNFLALSDIFHGEADLTLEWRLVRYANAVFLLYLGFSVWTLLRARRLPTP